MCITGRDKIESNEILVVSFGTTSPDSRLLNIDAVENTIRKAASDDYVVRRCFTSQTVINIIRRKEGVIIDNVTEALDRAVLSGIRKIAVQPTHLMNGIEFDKLERILSEYSSSFDKIALGDPLLTSDEDFRRVAEALIRASAEYDDKSTALVFMGHGTEAESNSIYKKMQDILSLMGQDNYYIGTVEAEPSVDSLIETINKGNYQRVVLRPLMLVAGNHAVNDMASSDDPGSWYSRFTSEGYETLCIIEGLGQLPDVRDIYADHVLKVLSALE